MPAYHHHRLLADETGSLDAFPEAASTFAADIDRLFWFISIVCIVFFVAITYCLIQFTLRYHKPKGEKAESSATHNTPLELAWSVLPSFFLIAMFVMGAQAYLDHRTVPDGANELRVKAYKWDWGIDYGRGVINPELHILLGEPTKLTMVSDDVIHSLYIPAFRAKKDVVPGRFNYMWFKPTVASEKVDAKILEEAKTWHESLEGKAWAKDSSDSWNYDRFQFTADGYTFFDLYCAEYCGTNHSEMQTVVVVHETLDDLNAWIKKYSKRQPGETPAEYGRLLYQRRGCVGCHSEDGIKRTGPTFQNLYGSEHLLANGE
ncbi:MAG: cytochrome C, partial [Pirellulales bacterium]|nr:cytochrome C [Pirellulales bacterium]